MAKMKDLFIKVWRRLPAIFMIIFGFFLVVNLGTHFAQIKKVNELANPGIWFFVVISFVFVFVGLKLLIKHGGDDEEISKSDKKTSR